MSDAGKIIYAKCLLFGEHITLRGAQALATPLRSYSGQWVLAPDNTDYPYRESLREFAATLPETHFDRASFLTDLERGLLFESSIPTGYGAGSSGALVAATAHRYGRRLPTDILELRSLLARAESHFHGSSSGTDPLICYLEQPILINPEQGIQIIELHPPDNLQWYLLDTGTTRRTGPWVELFLKKFDHERIFREQCERLLFPASNGAIEALRAGLGSVLFELFHEISQFQQRYFAEFIPEELHDLWLTGLSGNEFRLKLCGAGGGGFMLALVRTECAQSFQAKVASTWSISRFMN